MPPEVSPCQLIFTTSIEKPLRSISNPLSSNGNNRGTKKMMITKRKLIPLLVFILSGISILRLLKISVITSISSFSIALPTAHLHTCSPSSPACQKTTSPLQGPLKNQPIFSTLTKKEYLFLSHILSLRAPCNLLVFGLEPQYLNLSSSINGGGTTVILEDNPEKLKITKTKHRNTRIYKVKYKTFAGEAYKLLKHSREDAACALQSGTLRKSRCTLALTKLPKEVYKRKWDVVVVDGPGGDTPDAPGRMAAIYTASVMARAGNMTDVVVHDVDRMIEKWFAWEFLCEENLISSKGKLWNFRIAGTSNLTKFCPAKTVTKL